MAKAEGRYEIQYRDLIKGRPGWWTGHHGIDLKDPEAYAEGVNKRHPARVVDKETGQIYGHPGCGICDEAHEGVDGSCLL